MNLEVSGTAIVHLSSFKSSTFPVLSLHCKPKGHGWKRESREKRGIFSDTSKPLLTPEEKEIRELRKQLREVELERDILKKAGAAPQ